MTPSRPVCLYHVRLPSPSPSLLSPSLSRVIFRLVRSPDTRWHVSICRLFTSIVICFTVCVLAWRDTNCSRRRRTLFRQTLGNQSMRLHLYRKCECLKALSYQGISIRQLKAVAFFVFGQNVQTIRNVPPGITLWAHFQYSVAKFNQVLIVLHSNN